MKVLVIGSGGREHALVWRLSKCPSVRELYAVPGNPGIAGIARCMMANSPPGYADVADSINADLTVVGPEAPLTAGVVDEFRRRKRAIVGPAAGAARLEGSKIFAKQFMERAGLPTARYEAAESAADARRALARFSFPVVLKADGLAAGKGVIIAQDAAEANAAIDALTSGEAVGDAGKRLVIEEFLRGEEVSFIALSDGQDVVAMEPTQDHKAIGDGDTGPNTGGMGAYCDSRILSPAQTSDILERVIHPVIRAMRIDGTPFTGFLYAGLMMTAAGPKVLEFNVRLGDPETQALMHRLDCDFAEVLRAAAKGSLNGGELRWRPDPSVCVVLAAAGYPGKPRVGDTIHGIAEAEQLGAAVFHAGTRLGFEGLETAGGRVLGVTNSGPDLNAAIRKTYEAANQIHFSGMQCRTDIGKKGLERWQTSPPGVS
jgi:phosphoribosylamine--glycine ligase